MANPTVAQLGLYNALADSFALSVDLNDGQTFTLLDVSSDGTGKGFEWDTPKPLLLDSGNVRTPSGRKVVRINQGAQNRTLKVHLLWGQGSDWTSWSTALHKLDRFLNGISENSPACLQFQASGSSTLYYFDVRAGWLDVDYQESLATQLIDDSVVVNLVCKPFPRGSRQWLQNLVPNAGFEAPMGGGTATAAPVVFVDSLANANAYAVQAGGAMISDFSGLPTTVLADAPARYYRCNEGSGATAVDGSRFGQHATIVGTVTYGTPGLLTGDVDTAFTLDGATSYLNVPTAGLATGAAAWSMNCPVKYTATPSGNQIVLWYGKNVANQGVYIQVDNTLKPTIAVFGGANAAGTAGSVTLNTVHQLSLTYDGTTLRGLLDGVQFAAITVTLSIVMGWVTVGAGFFSGVAGNFCACVLDEAMVFTSAISAARLLAYYTSETTTPTAIANAYRIPAGGRVSFGSPAWSALNTWQLRFRWMPNAQPTFYLHYTDANNNLSVQITQGTLALVHTIGGTAHTLASASLSSGSYLQFATNYWLQITQFPALAGNTPYVQAALLSDSAGALGSSLLSVGPVQTYDAVTALSGAPQIQVTGAPLPFGGNFPSVHQVTLFGPGSWYTNALAATVGTGAWVQDPTQTYPSGPVASAACVRLDAPPAGVWNANWNQNDPKMPVAKGGDVLGLSLAMNAVGVSGTATQSCMIYEWDANQNMLASNTVTGMTHTGATSGWITLSALYTVGATTAYVTVVLHAADAAAGASAGGYVLFDNLQVWDKTQTGMSSMPYCELRTTQSPAQLMVSGLLGDIPAPVVVACGLYMASWSPGQSALVALGRRRQATSTIRLVQPASSGTPSLDSSAYGGLSRAGNPGLLVISGLDQTGIYHLFVRSKTTNNTPSNVWMNADLFLRQGTWYGTLLGHWVGSTSYPFTTPNAWTRVDLGQVSLPPSPISRLVDLTQIVSSYSTNTPAGSPATYGGYLALLPVDAETFLATLTNPSGGNAVTQQWQYVYWDGVSAGTTLSLEPSAVPNPAHSGWSPVVTASTNQYLLPPTVALAGDSAGYVDPRQNAVAGGVPGVNQWLLLAEDSSANLLATSVDLLYNPLYRFPL